MALLRYLLDHFSPMALLLFVFVPVATVLRHVKKPEAQVEGLKGILQDALEAAVIILCIWGISVLVDKTFGPDRQVGGVVLHSILDYGHLAVLLRWMVKCLLRMLP